METLTFEKDVKVMYMAANSFPEGIEEAHKKLHSIVPFSTQRKYLGISRRENGTIVYKAGAEELTAGEAEKLKCPTLILPKGKYISVTINDFMKNIQSIGKTFEQLLTRPDLDPQGYCVEWYFNDKDMRCMVRLNENGSI